MKKLMLITLAALVLGGCNRLDNHQPLTSHKFYFSKINDLSQSFLSRRNELNTVYICLRNPDRSLIPLEFVLKDAAGNVVRSLAFTGGNIDNADCTKFQFEPVSDSAGKTYTAHIITKLDPKLEPRMAEGYRAGLYAEAHAGGDYTQGTAFIDGQATEYDLHFKTVFYQPWKQIVSESVTQLTARLTQDPLFMLVYVGLLIWIVAKLLHRK